MSVPFLFVPGHAAAVIRVGSARKTDFVVGEYTLDVSDGEATVAVKITDMLGEEVLVAQAA